METGGRRGRARCAQPVRPPPTSCAACRAAPRGQCLRPSCPPPRAPFCGPRGGVAVVSAACFALAAEKYLPRVARPLSTGALQWRSGGAAEQLARRSAGVASNSRCVINLTCARRRRKRASICRATLESTGAEVIEVLALLLRFILCLFLCFFSVFLFVCCCAPSRALLRLAVSLQGAPTRR